MLDDALVEMEKSKKVDQNKILQLKNDLREAKEGCK